MSQPHTINLSAKDLKVLKTTEYWTKWKRKFHKCVFHMDLGCAKLEESVINKITRLGGVSILSDSELRRKIDR
jgi:hypothetical protein